MTGIWNTMRMKNEIIAVQVKIIGNYINFLINISSKQEDIE
jgi:hypothetical protein